MQRRFARAAARAGRAYRLRQTAFSDYSQRMDTEQVRRVRSFNRTVSQRIGALKDHFLDRHRPLGKARLLYEIGPPARRSAICARDWSSIPVTSVASCARSSVSGWCERKRRRTMAVSAA